jgi:transcriptional regulator with XRE-family HTH domain
MMIGSSRRAVYQVVGSKIREQRVKLGLTQEELAAQVGLSRSSITNVEQGRQTILLHQFLEIAQALEISPQALFPELRFKESPQIPNEIAHLVKRLKANR